MLEIPYLKFKSLLI